MGDLIARLEQAEGPSRELDSAIAAHLGFDGWTATEWAEVAAEMIQPTIHRAPHYTSSLDAAVSLVPDGCEVRLTMHTDPAFVARASVQQHVVDVTMPSHRGRTPALALCVAALRARMAAKEGRGDG